METQLQEYDNRRFMIFSVTELNQINFNEVLETSSDTVRKSVDQTKTFVKWDGVMPECVTNLITKEGPYTYDEIITILLSSEWTEPSEI
jgi:hypothetical protein